MPAFNLLCKRHDPVSPISDFPLWSIALNYHLGNFFVVVTWWQSEK